MLDIRIITIPHTRQRYDTIGDWEFKGKGLLVIKVSSLKNPFLEFLIARHELDEAMLCHKAGISTKQVDDFDMNYKGEGEPGDDLKCPYRIQHQLATIAEKQMADWLNINWKQYEEEIEKLFNRREY